MNDRSTERLLTRLAEGNLTEEEHGQLLELVHQRTHNAQIKRIVSQTVSQYVKREKRIEDLLSEIDLADARQRSSRTLNNIRTLIRSEQEQAREARVVPFYQSWSRMAAAAAVIVAMFFGGMWYYRAQLASDLLANTIIFENRQFIHLPDGSTAWLNDGSKLSYHKSFGDTVREVTLTGEAYFDVKHDPSHPFRVRTGDVTTTVLGTAFNVHAYAGENNIVVTVARGKVKVSNAINESQVVQPDQQLSVNQTTNAIATANVDAAVATEWKEKFLILDNVTIQEAATIIGERYHVEVRVTEMIRDCKIRGAFVNNESMEQVLDVMSLLVDGAFTTQDGVVSLTGKGCR